MRSTLDLNTFKFNILALNQESILLLAYIYGRMMYKNVSRVRTG
jgi:hypothetical protein